MAEVILNDNNFTKEVLKSEKPVLVDFWAEWCAPCKMMTPILQEVDEYYEGKVKIGKLNVEKNPLAARRFSVNKIPLLILFKDGNVAKKFIGVRPKKALISAVEKIL